ncbi:MAG: 16S rRNA (guanine(527)-N(7))-methyltransferase RsmG [Cyclobacteriaceae bacterium]
MEVINQYFPDLSAKQKEQFTLLGQLYLEWNEKINVISRKDINELYVRHVLHSLSICKIVQFVDGASILDVGTGGGFPGIPLAIMFPQAQFHLVDSIGKKIKVVNEVANALKLENVKGEHARAEKVKDQFDFVLTRAVARARVIWNWSQQKVSNNQQHDIDNGIIALKGGDMSEELKELKRPYQLTPISRFFAEPFFETKQIVYIPK